MYTHVKNGQQITTPQKVHPPSRAPSPHRETACPGGACHVLGLVLVVCRYMEKCAEMLRKTRAYAELPYFQFDTKPRNMLVRTRQSFRRQNNKFTEENSCQTDMTLNWKVPNGKYRDSRFCYQINTEAAPILSSTVKREAGTQHCCIYCWVQNWIHMPSGPLVV